MPRKDNYREDLVVKREEKRKAGRKVLRSHKCDWGVLLSGIVMRYACSEKASIKRLRLMALPPEEDGWRLHAIVMQGQQTISQTSKAIKADMPLFDTINLLPHQTLSVIATPKAGQYAADVPYTLDYFVDIG